MTCYLMSLKSFCQNIASAFFHPLKPWLCSWLRR
jgi:hypothetical protein